MPRLETLWIAALAGSRISDPDKPREPNSLLNWKVTLVLPVLLALVIFRVLPLRLKLAERQQAYARMLLDTPNAEGLPLIPDMTDDEAFILADMDGFHPGQRSSSRDLVNRLAWIAY